MVKGLMPRHASSCHVGVWCRAVIEAKHKGEGWSFSFGKALSCDCLDF